MLCNGEDRCWGDMLGRQGNAAELAVKGGNRPGRTLHVSLQAM